MGISHPVSAARRFLPGRNHTIQHRPPRFGNSRIACCMIALRKSVHKTNGVHCVRQPVSMENSKKKGGPIICSRYSRTTCNFEFRFQVQEQAKVRVQRRDGWESSTELTHLLALCLFGAYYMRSIHHVKTPKVEFERRHSS